MEVPSLQCIQVSWRVAERSPGQGWYKRGRTQEISTTRPVGLASPPGFRLPAQHRGQPASSTQATAPAPHHSSLNHTSTGVQHSRASAFSFSLVLPCFTKVTTRQARQMKIRANSGVSSSMKPRANSGVSSSTKPRATKQLQIRPDVLILLSFRLWQGHHALSFWLVCQKNWNRACHL